jgi:hypothetical protein
MFLLLLLAGKRKKVPCFTKADRSFLKYTIFPTFVNPLNAVLNPICHSLPLLGAHHILHVSAVRVKLDFNKRGNMRVT